MQLLRKRTVGHLALLMASVLFVVACGAAAPVATPTPPPPTPTPPPPPPTFTVTATSPAAGATGVSPATTIRVTFSAAVATAGAGAPCTAGNLVISPAPIAGPVACAVAAGGAAVDWSGLVLNSATTYTVTVQPQVASATGVLLGGTGHTFSFTTRFWTAPPTTVNATLIQMGSITSAGFLTCGPGLPGTCVVGESPAGVGNRLFMAFATPVGLAGAVVFGANYTSSYGPGNPVNSGTTGALTVLGGAILAEGVSWLVQVTPGVLDVTDYAAPALAGPIVALGSPPVPDTGVLAFDATAIVMAQRALVNIGFRFRFAVDTNAVPGADNTVIGGPITLTIGYAVP